MLRRDRTVTLLALAVLSAAFLAFAAAYTGRAVNNAWGDIDLGGWSAVLGHRLLGGERLYRELVVAVPPGAPAVLAAIEWISGRGPRLLHEVWVCALSCLALSWLAYAIARPFVGRDNALFVAAGTLVWVCGWSRELASDYLAQVAAYAVIAVFVRAAADTDERRGRRRFAMAGGLAGAAIFFEQHTGFGAFVALLAGAGCLAVFERQSPGRFVARGLDALAACGGSAAAVVVAVALVWAFRGSPLGLLRAVFVDGVALRGGPGFLVRDALHGLSLEPVARMSLAQVAGLVGLASIAISRHRRDGPGALAVGGAEDVGAHARPRIATAASAVGLASVALVWAAFALARDWDGPRLLSPLAGVAFGVVQSGVVLVVGLCYTSLREGSHASGGSLGRAFAASAIVALTIAIAVSASQAAFAPLGDANPTIVVALSAVFLSLELSGLGALRIFALALLVAVPLSSKLPRCGLATTWTDAPFLTGVRVNQGGRDIANAVRRVRALTSDRDTVLVMPEDPMLVAWIGRPRPALCGGIVTVDQYPDRCIAVDLDYLEKHPPKVVVTRPTDPKDWETPFRRYGRASPAELVIVAFTWRNVLAYTLDSHYRTAWSGDRGVADLDVWVHR